MNKGSSSKKSANVIFKFIIKKKNFWGIIILFKRIAIVKCLIITYKFLNY